MTLTRDFNKTIEARKRRDPEFEQCLKIGHIADEVATEVERAVSLFPAMNSPHEAAFVIEEEWEEYRQEVFKHNTSKPNRDTRPRQREELIQLAAMCIRAILDTIDKEKV